jgi:hypothetical protein
MREHVDRLLAQTTLVTLALAIAVGWSLFQVAKGVADLVTGVLSSYPDATGFGVVARSQPATWVVGDRVLTFTTLIEGLVELAVVLLVAVLIATRERRGRPA